MSSQSPELEIPSSVGPFRIVRMLGQGGTGVVYLGERTEHFSQRVAIKFLNLISLSGNEAASLESEEEILTALDHPCIVRLLDKGRTPAGLRYIVMEYVEGSPLDEYCDAKRLGLESRIRLLVQVMNAIAYAHRHFVIHADLKPSNLLVNGEGQPKLLDFGISALFSGRRQPAADAESLRSPFTPAFASPEQRNGQRVTPASDLYSMAIVAGVVLAGVSSAVAAGPTSPMQAFQNLDRESQSAIASQRGMSGSALKDALRGDLDAILEKGRRAEPERRYRSADEFASDLRAFLEYRPVSARRGGGLYKTGKWMLRHRVAASVSALFLIVASFSVIGVVEQTARAAHQRGVAQANLHDLVRLTGLLDGELYGSIATLPRAEKAKAILLQGTKTTLDQLAQNSGRDAVLEMELARQYATLASLQLEVGGNGQDLHRREAMLDLDRADAMLKNFPANDNRVITMRQQMLTLRQSVAAK